MSNSRLNELMSSLSKDEMMEVKDYVNSPAVNKDAKVRRLFEYLMSGERGMNEITKEDMIKAVFGDGGGSDVYIRVVITGLVKVIERYLADKKLADDEMRINLYLMETFRERGCRKSFNRHLKEVRENAECEKEKDAGFYLKEAECMTESFMHGKNPSNVIDMISEADAKVELAYMTFKLDVYFRMLIMNIQGVKSGVDRKKFSNLLKETEKREKEIQREHVLLYIKYLSVKMLTAMDETKNIYYIKLKGYLKKDVSEGTEMEIYRNLLAYCRLKRLVKGDESYGKEELKLYKQMLKAYPGYKPTPAELEAITECARSEGEMVWAEGVKV